MGPRLRPHEAPKAVASVRLVGKKPPNQPRYYYENKNCSLKGPFLSYLPRQSPPNHVLQFPSQIMCCSTGNMDIVELMPSPIVIRQFTIHVHTMLFNI